MTKLQVMGPKRKTEGPVTYQQTFTRSPKRLDSQFMVTIKLGDHLRHQATKRNHTTVTPNGSPRKRIHMGPTYGIAELNGDSEHNESSSIFLSESEILRRKQERILENQLTPYAMPGQETVLPKNHQSILAPFVAPFEFPNNLQAIQNTNTEENSESDLEILEVRPLRPSSAPLSSDNTYIDRNEQEDDTDSDISVLDEELNQALSSTTTISTQVSQRSKIAMLNPILKLLPNLCKQVGQRSPPPPGFRNIPPNLVNAIQRELNFFYDNMTDDDVEVVGKMAFSLQDPIARTKIRLPIKATTCRHFECFDFYNFCLYYDLSTGTRNGLKTNMLLQSKESRESEEKFYQQQRKIAEGKMLIKSPGLIFPQFSEHGQMFFTDIYSRTPPLYKCPLCDEKFGLKQLYISDVFNFFVKTTPAHVTKIELVENDRYKIVEEETVENSDEQHDVVELDDDEEEDKDDVNSGNVKSVETTNSIPNVKTNESASELGFETTAVAEVADRSMTSEDFNDGLDDVLLGLKQGDGSWFHPLTLD